MVTAIANSIHAPGKLTQPKAETANEMLCPKVKAVIQRNVGFQREKLNGSVSASRKSI